MTDREAVNLLRAISNLALLGYPYPAGTVLDDKLALALGKIAGMASQAAIDWEYHLIPSEPP